MSIKEELDDYKVRLVALKASINGVKNTQVDTHLNHASQAGVLIVAIDGLLDRLSKVDIDEIKLPDIVDLSDSINNVCRSGGLFLERQSNNTIARQS